VTLSFDSVTFETEYQPPFDWASVIRFVNGRRLAGVESIDEHRYRRTLAVDEHRGWIVVHPAVGKYALRVEASASLAPVINEVRTRVRRYFDLDADPRIIGEHLGALASANPGLRVPGAFDGFEVASRAILGQQISVKAATTLAGRIAAAFGDRVETPFENLTHLSPTAAQVSGADPEVLVAIGVVRARAASIVRLARAAAEGRIALRADVDPDVEMEKLKQIPGVGEWTAQYIAMRAMGFSDAFPHTDLGIYKALAENRPRRVLELSEDWRPWRAYAAMHLWKSLESVR